MTSALRRSYANTILLILFTGFTVLFYRLTPSQNIYPPIFSKRFPLSTPASFWASTLGMRRVAADIAWVQAFQYYGSYEGDRMAGLIRSNNTDLSFPELISYWQQIIRIDPIYAHIHLIAPTTIAWNHRRHEEAMQLIDESIKTIERIRMNFSSLQVKNTDKDHPFIMGKQDYFKELLWKLYTLKTVLVYFNQEEFKKAVPLLENLVAKHDTPDEVKIMLAQIYEQKGDILKAVLMWEIVYRTAEKENKKLSASYNINRLGDLINSSR